VNLLGNVTSNILFIVEGEEDEGKLLRKLNKVIDSNNIYSIFSFSTTIHEMHKLYIELKEDDFLTLQGLLKENSNDESEKRILSRRYKSIYLIFDFDPHYQKYSADIINDMYNFFNDSREYGKLFLNYPMMQSYRHMSRIPDPNFKLSKVSHSDCYEYKRIVGDESSYTDLNKYNFAVVINFIYHHYSKMNYLLNGKYNCGTIDEYISKNDENLKRLLTLQNTLFGKSSEIYIINTSIFYIIDLLPETFYKKYSNLLFR
jgi:hypothetical protein